MISLLRYKEASIRLEVEFSGVASDLLEQRMNWIDIVLTYQLIT